MKMARKLVAFACSLLLVFSSFHLPAALAEEPAPAGPLPSDDGQIIQSLNGNWHFRIDPAGIGEQQGWQDPGHDRSQWDRLRVPGNWDVRNEYSDYAGIGWYARTFAVPAEYEGFRVRLKFEAVYFHARVWVNGVFVGEHYGGYTPFEFDVSELLRYGGSDNLVVVAADNRYGTGAWWKWGGISGDVDLIVNNDARILWQKITPEPDLASGEAVIRTEVKVENDAGEDRTFQVRLRIRDWETGAVLRDWTTDPALSASVTVAAGSAGTAAVSTTLPPALVELWHFDDPNLYVMETHLEEDGTLLHRIEDRFGIRKVEIVGTEFRLNGEPVRLVGFNRVPDDRVNGNTEPDYLVMRDLDYMKTMGANMARIFHTPLSQNVLDYADEIGILLIGEIPVWGGRTAYDMTYARQWLREMIERDYNHPSIFAWSVANEIDGNEPAGMEFIREHIDYVRSELDSSRYLTYAMHQGKIGATPDGDAAQYVDFISVNLYGDGSSAVNRLHSLWPDKPIFLSEFGSSQTSEDPNKGNFKVEGLLQAYKRDYIMGVSLWTLNDYRSNFPGTPPSQNRAWGVTTVWGEKKRAFERVRAAYAPVRLSVEHSAANFVPGTTVLSNIRVIPRSADADIPSYTMRGYKLKWEIYDRSGRAREGGLLDLDTIRPGDPEIRLPVSWIVPDDALYMRVTVITPLQYEIVETISDLDVPDAPVIRDVLVADGAVRVIFDKVNGAREYRVVYGETTLAASSEATINNFVDITGLQNGKAYRFAVVAMNGKGESNKSPVVTAVPTFLYDRLPPVLWAAVPVEGGVYIGYSVENEDAEFTLEYGESPDRTTNVITGIRNRGAYLVSGLEGGKTYYFRMKRAGSYGESGFSQAIAAVPETALQLPPAPEIVAAAAGDGQVSLQFTTVPKATGYVIRYGTSPGETLGEIPVRSAAVGQYVVSGLQNGTAYYFAVRARTASGLSPWSGEVSAVPAPVQAPGLSHQVDPGEGEWEAGTVRTLRLHLSNLGLAALQAEVELQLPAGFTGAGLTQSVTIHPGDTTEVSWDIAIDALQEPGTYHLTAIIRYGDGEELRVVIPVTVKRYEILFAEDFETDLSRWTTATGTGDLSADADSQAFRHLAPSTTTFALSHAGDGDWADYIVSAKMKMVGALNPTLKTGGYSAGIVFRYLDANNFYHLRLDHNFGTGVSKVQLYRWVNGAPSNLREVVYDWTDGQWYTLKAAVRGNQIDAYVNGVLMFSVTDSSLAAGKVGFRTYGAEALFDDVIVTDWGEGGGPSVDLTALEDAIHYAESLLARHPAGDQPGEVPQEAADELLSEIQLARQILSDPNLTQEAADSAAARLNDAAARFLEQVIPDPAEPVIRHVIRLDAPHLDAGGQTALTVRLHNAGHTQRSVTLTLELPGSLTADQIEKTVTLDAGQDGEASFTLTAAPDAAAGTYNFIVKVAYDGGQSTLAETVALQVRQYEWLFTEDFEGTADRWTLVSGTGGVKEDDGSRAYELVAPGATSSALVTAGDASWNDYTVRARMKIASFHPDNNGYSAGILFRYVNNSNFYHFRVEKNSGAQLYKWVNGSAVNMGSRNVPWSVGAWAELKVVVQGDTITAYFNGQPVFNVTDSAHAAGKIGFRSYAATAVFDDVAVYRDSAPIDKTALQAAIGHAQGLLDGAVVGTEPGQYAQEDVDLLADAIAAARAVLDDPQASQEAVDAAVDALNQAVARFQASVITHYIWFQDDFGDGDANGWTIYNGNWSVVPTEDGYALRANALSPVTESIALAGDPQWADYTVEMDVRYDQAINPDGTAASGLIARYSDYNNFYLLRLNQNGNAELMKKKGGSYTLLASAPLNLEAGKTYTLKLDLDGRQLTGFVDGVQLISVEDADLAAGMIGFRAYGQVIRIERVKVTSDERPAGADKTALQNLAETAAQLEADDYMPAGWAQLQAALALAQGVLDAEDSTRAEVNAAMEELQYAMRNLATRPDGLPDGVEKVPYRMDTLNQAGWWAPLAVDGDTAYLAYNEPSVREGNHHIAVAVRDGGGNWSKLPAMNGAARAEYIDDLGHNQPSIALDGNGILHMFASMHNDTWRYFALDPVSGTMQNRSADMPDQGDLLTYPVTARDPNGDVWLIIRSAASDRRVGKLYRYDHEQKTWTKEAIFASAPGRSVYPDDMLVDGEGNVHILFEWAPNPAAAVRHELSYLKYDPDTKTFHKADGTAVEGPVTPETADVIQPLTEGEGYNDTFGVQSAKLVLDENGRPMVAYRYRSADSQGMFVVKFARFTGEAWETETVFRLAETKAAIDITHHASGTRIYYVLASGQDCARVAVRQGEGWVNASVAPGIPAERLSAVTNDSGVDILYLADVENEALYYAELDSVDLEGDIPPAPTGLVTTGVSNLRVDLAWTAPNGGDGIAGYHIYRNGQRIGSSPVPAFSDMEVEAGTGYTYTVTAVGMSNLESAPSGALDVITLGHPALPFQDDFEQNGMVNWRVVSGTWTLEAGDSTRLVQSNTAGEGLVFAGNPHWTDYTAEMELTLNDIRDHAASGLLVRYVDESNYYILRLHQSGQLQLYKNAGGSFTLLGSASAAVSAESTYKLKLKAEGDHLTAYLNGEEKIAVTDDAFPRGAVGVRSYNQSIAVDNVTVKAVPNRTALQNAIAQAQTLALQTAVGTEPGQVPQAAMDDLLAAIAAAEFVLRDDNAGQEDLDAAITALQAAIAAFLAAIIPEPQAPAWENGVLQASNVGVTEVTLSWSGAKDEQGVSAYRIYINGTPGDPLAAEDLTVTDGVYSHTVTGLAPETTYVFKVEAGNARNLWSTDGPVVTVTTLPAQQQEPEPTEPEDTQAPVWNGGQLTVRDVTATRLVLAWTPASDNVAVTAYRVYRNGGLIAEVAGDVLTLEVTGLAPSTAYTFKVEAGDAAGNWSTDGPAASVTTPSASTPPVTPPPTSTPPAEPPRQEEPAEEPAEEEPAEEKPAVRVEAADEALAEAVSGKGTGDALARVRLASPVYEVTFEGDEAPAEPVKIELAYDPSGVDEALLGVYGYNEETETWEYVGGEIGPGTGVMVAEASRPGLYAVMEYDKTFADVPEEHWAHAAIRQLSARHIVKGVSGEEFAPGKRTTRAEFAALLARALGLEAEAGEGTPFADVPEGAWYAEAVAAAHAAGLIEGLTEEAFGPDEPISREQMAVLLVRAYALLTGKEIAAGTDHLAGYTDGEDVSGWAREAVNAAIELGLMQGKGGGQFAPKEEATRAETAMVIWKLLNLLKQAAS